MTIGNTGFTSVIGLSFLEPILRLIEQLDDLPAKPPGEVKTNYKENGYSCAIIVISVLLLESAINRARSISGTSFDRGISSCDYLIELLNDSNQENIIEEIFSIRDAIVHNHLWNADVGWDSEGNLVFVTEPQLQEGFGNKRFQRVLQESSQRTKVLELNLLPSRIWRYDAYSVLEYVYKLLLKIENIDRNYFYISPHHFEFRGELLPIDEVISSIRRSSSA
jgi:hypothetical protein